MTRGGAHLALWHPVVRRGEGAAGDLVAVVADFLVLDATEPVATLQERIRTRVSALLDTLTA